MPRISEFYGIAIYMYYEDHEPPHFHAIYGSREALIGIGSGEVLRGTLPGRALQLVLDWSRMHAAELRSNWDRARGHIPLEPIAPLD